MRASGATRAGSGFTSRLLDDAGSSRGNAVIWRDWRRLATVGAADGGRRRVAMVWRGWRRLATADAAGVALWLWI